MSSRKVYIDGNGIRSFQFRSSEYIGISEIASVLASQIDTYGTDREYTRKSVTEMVRSELREYGYHGVMVADEEASQEARIKAREKAEELFPELT